MRACAVRTERSQPCAPGRQRGSGQVRPAQNVSLTYTWSFQRPPLSVSLSAAFSSRLKSKREGAPCAAAAVTRREAGRLLVALALHRRVTFRPLPLARRGGPRAAGGLLVPVQPGRSRTGHSGESRNVVHSASRSRTFRPCRKRVLTALAAKTREGDEERWPWNSRTEAR